MTVWNCMESPSGTSGAGTRGGCAAVCSGHRDDVLSALFVGLVTRRAGAVHNTATGRAGRDRRAVPAQEPALGPTEDESADQHHHQDDDDPRDGARGVVALALRVNVVANAVAGGDELAD